jgi:acyl-CoA synthetase (AMP-forming)/AMP-acid ligase II
MSATATTQLRVESLLAAPAAATPTALAVRDPKRSVTYAELLELSQRLAGGLAQIGVRAGDRVAVLARNRVETVALYFAVAQLDAVLLPINWRLAPPEVHWILAHSGAQVLLADPEFARAQAGGLEGALLPVAFDGALDGALDGWSTFESLAQHARLAVSDSAASADVAAVQMYTSGTTGRPKGAMLSHRNVVEMTRAWLADMPLRGAQSRFLQVTPLFHVGGMLMLMATISSGSELHLLAEFDPALALETLVRERITHTLMVPAMVQWCLAEHAQRPASFPHLELMAYGAAPMPVPTLLRAMEVFECSFLQGYGLTETSGVLLTLTPEDHRWNAGEAPPARLASAGRAVACSQVRVVNAAGLDVARCSAVAGRAGRAEVGEILARGSNVMLGYHGDSRATADAFAEGWLRTGDLAWVDLEGYVYVVDRSKDMLLVGGENVYPREIENVLLQNEVVADAAVIGVPHATWGEEPLAFVVLREGGLLDGRTLSRFCRGALARFKCPTRFEFVASLPRNSAGKLQKALLREPYWRGLERKV